MPQTFPGELPGDAGTEESELELSGKPGPFLFLAQGGSLFTPEQGFQSQVFSRVFLRAGPLPKDRSWPLKYIPR